MLTKVYDIRPEDKILCEDGHLRQVIKDVDDFFIEHMGGNYIQIKYTDNSLSPILKYDEDELDVIS